VIDLLREWVREVLLVEGRLQDAIESAPEWLEGEVRKMANADPSGNLKYLAWQVKQLLNLLEPSNFLPVVNDQTLVGYYVPMIIKVVNLFHHRSKQLDPKDRDINVHQDYAELFSTLEDLGPSRSEIRRETKKGIRKIFDDGRYLVIQPTTEVAACHNGKGTRWCISAVESDNAFEEYSDQGVVFYFVIDRAAPSKERYSKIAIAIPSEGSVSQNTEIYDANDDNIHVSNLHDAWGPDKGWEIIEVISKDLNESPIEIFGHRVAAWSQGATSTLFQDGSPDDIREAISDYPSLAEDHEVQGILVDRGFINLLLSFEAPIDPQLWTDIISNLKERISLPTTRRWRYVARSLRLISARGNASRWTLRSVVGIFGQLVDGSMELSPDLEEDAKEISHKLAQNGNMTPGMILRLLFKVPTVKFREPILDTLGWVGRLDVMDHILKRSPADLDGLVIGVARRFILDLESLDEEQVRERLNFVERAVEVPGHPWVGEKGESLIKLLTRRAREAGKLRSVE